MRSVTAQQLESWLEGGKVLEKDGRGPKVVALTNGLFLKIFHTRRHPLLARLQPAAKRFADNANRLNLLGIAAPKVVDLFWLERTQGLSGCLYEPLPGQSVEQIYLAAPQQAQQWLGSVAQFIRHLHRQGIYFRSLHLGNILRLPSGNYGLIDILDLQHKRRALSNWQIKRNFQHLRHYLKRKRLPEFPIEQLIGLYQDIAEGD
ncbi:phosphotransferase [Pseudomonas fulva]|uniref:Aminoglycoside phosphotransferase n=1 Tax=Pseudomonas fulva (strain 12-X) TaxID=743720 RepID=F6AKQ2_PSEF1|nr:phosphotransferase [Pseudomonas fulva]AEF24126.1 aminoglycoside phosphotransferase [Pseudomonas fulva 12-X]